MTTWPKRFRGRDGCEYIIRPIRPDDVERMLDFLAHLSPETRYRRFHMPLPDPPREELLRRVGETVDVPPEKGVALVALVGDTIVGSARCMRAGCDAEAEAAVVVRDDYQGKGIGTQLLLELVAEARKHGVSTLYAYIQPDNQRILKLLRRAHLPTTTRLEGSALRVDVDIREAPSRG